VREGPRAEDVGKMDPEIVKEVHGSELRIASAGGHDERDIKKR